MKCQHLKAKVIDSRTVRHPHDGLGSIIGPSIRRRRKCLTCGRRWTTYELQQGAIQRIKAFVICADNLREGLTGVRASLNRLQRIATKNAAR